MSLATGQVTPDSRIKRNPDKPLKGLLGPDKDKVRAGLRARGIIRADPGGPVTLKLSVIILPLAAP